MIIIGAGLSGLLAANMFRKHDPIIYEKSGSLPNNHTALLRHREEKIAEATSIPFKRVKVQKGVILTSDPIQKRAFIKEPNAKISNMYSFKVTGSYLNRSIDNLDDVYRYIAPEDFIHKMSIGLNIQYGSNICKEDIERWAKNKETIISTMPMLEMGRIIGYNLPFEFQFRTITVLTCDLFSKDICEIYQTLYYPESSIDLYRASITGNRLILEFIGEPHNIKDDENLIKFIEFILEYDFGINHPIHINNIKIKKNKYGKIKDVHSPARKAFIKYLTDAFNIYSLGRYAIWKNILLDDVHQDVLVIQKLIEADGYFTGK